MKSVALTTPPQLAQFQTVIIFAMFLVCCFQTIIVLMVCSRIFENVSMQILALPIKASKLDLCCAEQAVLSQASTHIFLSIPIFILPFIHIDKCVQEDILDKCIGVVKCIQEDILVD